jgi:hypothetical protein
MELVYRGAIDDSPRDADAVERRYIMTVLFPERGTRTVTYLGEAGFPLSQHVPRTGRESIPQR